MTVLVHDLSIDDELKRIEWLIDLLDRGFRLPGTSFRFGLDPLIGLIPGVGDLASLFASIYVVERLSRLGLPAGVRFRMFANVFLDFVIGVVPVVGDLLDFAFKANVRNYELAKRALDRN